MKRTKKLIAVALLAAIGTTAQAQIVSSQSEQVVVTQEVEPVKPKTPIKYSYYVKGCVSMDFLTLKESGVKEFETSCIGYELVFGLTNAAYSKGLVWGIELGGMSNLNYHNYYFERDGGGYESESDFSLQASPYLGLKIKNKHVSISPYLGPFVCYGADNLSSAQWRAGISAGFNAWLSMQWAIGLNFKKDLWEDSGDSLKKINLSVIYAI